MPRRKKRKDVKQLETYPVGNQYWTPVHSDKTHVWIVEYYKSKKCCGGEVKKVEKSFLESQELFIFTM